MAGKSTKITTVRELPSVEEALGSPALESGASDVPRPLLVDCVRAALADARERLQSGAAGVTLQSIEAAILKRATQLRREGPVRVINCAGALAHTNLGRAPFSAAYLSQMSDRLAGYCALEFDLASGKRGSRGVALERALCALTGAEAALVVNNCAAAVFLTLNTLSNRKETIVSRGELVQIGGGFRVPAIMKQSGAKLIEVGATNITTLADYQGAIGPKTALLLKVSKSNFTQHGFVEEQDVKALSALARERNLPLAFDLGSGLPVDPREVGLDGHDSLRSALTQGADIVCASGDKLFGSVQAGIILGAADYLKRLRQNPVYRALRPDKFTLAILHDSVNAYLDGSWKTDIPFWRLALRAESELYQLGREIIERLNADGVLTLEAVSARYGGGALPEVELPSCALAFSAERNATALARKFRDLSVPIIGRVEHDRFMLDLRALMPEDEPAFRDGLATVLKSLS
ncbi:MAG TPA: L-seryl-tRNA(Sec) selenium transferase [candidate division Zixibacteria bacterium]|nr:L-seryl-tRNA(Sec) selenium transferase [candidate division Zixibacteria bacterium]